MAYTQLDNGADVLRVPSHTQPDAENECMVFCVYMVLEYCRTAHPVELIRQHTPGFNIDEVKELLTIREMGWALNENDIETLSAVTSPLTFTLKEFERSPSSQTLRDIIHANLDSDLPTITIVDAIRLEAERKDRQIAENNEQSEHAVVVIGMDERNVYINDPWGSAREPIDHDVFAEAWDVGLNRLVTANLQTSLDAHH